MDTYIYTKEGSTQLASKQKHVPNGLVPVPEEQIDDLSKEKQPKCLEIKREVEKIDALNGDVQNSEMKVLLAEYYLHKDDFDELERLLCNTEMGVSNEDQQRMDLKLVPCRDILSILEQLESRGNCKMVSANSSEDTPDSQTDSYDSTDGYDCLDFASSTRRVTIKKRETQEYMQVNKGHVMFDELKSQKPSQGVKDFHQCHFLQENKTEFTHGKMRLLTQFRYEQTSKYLCMTEDGGLGLDENPKSFLIHPSKGKSYLVLEEMETNSYLSADQHGAKFETKYIDNIELAPNRLKIIIQKI